MQPAAPQAESAPVEPAAPQFVLKLDWPSDLVQIETDQQKARAAAEAAANEPPRVYAKRVRPPLLPMSNEPLVQVETKPRDSGAGLHA